MKTDEILFVKVLPNVVHGWTASGRFV